MEYAANSITPAEQILDMTSQGCLKEVSAFAKSSDQSS